MIAIRRQARSATVRLLARAIFWRRSQPQNLVCHRMTAAPLKGSKADRISLLAIGTALQLSQLEGCLYLVSINKSESSPSFGGYMQLEVGCCSVGPCHANCRERWLSSGEISIDQTGMTSTNKSLPGTQWIYAICAAALNIGSLWWSTCDASGQREHLHHALDEIQSGLKNIAWRRHCDGYVFDNI